MKTLQKENLIPFKSSFDVYTYSQILEETTFLTEKEKEEIRQTSCKFLQTKVINSKKISELNFLFLWMKENESCPIHPTKPISMALKEAFNNNSDAPSSLLYYSTFPLVFIFKKKPKLSFSSLVFEEKSKNVLQNIDKVNMSQVLEQRLKVFCETIHAIAIIIQNIPIANKLHLRIEWFNVFKKVFNKTAHFFIINQEKYLYFISNLFQSFFLIQNSLAHDRENEQDVNVKDAKTKLLLDLEKFQNSNVFFRSIELIISIFQSAETTAQILETYLVLKLSSSTNLKSELWSIKVKRKNKLQICNLIGKRIKQDVEIFVENEKHEKEEMKLIDKSNPAYSSSNFHCTYTTEKMSWTRNEALQFLIKIDKNHFKYTREHKPKPLIHLSELSITLSNISRSSNSKSRTIFDFKKENKLRILLLENISLTFKAKFVEDVTPLYVILVISLKKNLEGNILNLPKTKTFLCQKHENYYTLTLNFSNNTPLPPVRGLYEFEFLASNHLIENPIRIKMLTVELRFPTQLNTNHIPIHSRDIPLSDSSEKNKLDRVLSNDINLYPLPLISYTFDPPVTPPHPLIPLFSLVFVTIIPFICLIWMWYKKIGIDMELFDSKSLWHWSFILLLLAKVVVILLYFSVFNLITTIRILIPFVLIFIFVGNKVLCDVYNKRKCEALQEIKCSTPNEKYSTPKNNT